jgi:hypothetical protein
MKIEEAEKIVENIQSYKKLYCANRVLPECEEGSAILDGSFTVRELEALSIVLKKSNHNEVEIIENTDVAKINGIEYIKKDLFDKMIHETEHQLSCLYLKSNELEEVVKELKSRYKELIERCNKLERRSNESANNRSTNQRN